MSLFVNNNSNCIFHFCSPQSELKVDIIFQSGGRLRIWVSVESRIVERITTFVPWFTDYSVVKAWFGGISSKYVSIRISTRYTHVSCISPLVQLIVSFVTNKIYCLKIS